jgi:hypothetical protein
MEPTRRMIDSNSLHSRRETPSERSARNEALTIIDTQWEKLQKCIELNEGKSRFPCFIGNHVFEYNRRRLYETSYRVSDMPCKFPLEDAIYIECLPK